MNYTNLIFDLDGTLWDSRASIVQNWNRVLSEAGLLKNPLKAEDMNPHMGRLPTDILRDFFPDITNEKIQFLLQEITQTENEYIQQYGGILYENVDDTLKELSKTHKLFIVSNCNDGYIEAFLAYFGYESLFEDFESFGRTGKTKAENIQLLMNRNQIESSKAVYIGDTATDYASAMDNELDFIFCAYGFGEVDSKEVKKIQQLGGLLDILCNFQKT